MTREEAIKGLETLSKSFSGYKPNEEMFEMAVSALKAQDATDTNVGSNGDTIYRQMAIDVLMEILDRPNHAEFLYTDEICRALGQLPSAQPVKDINVHSNDCISRQEVIRLILERGLYCDTQEDREVSADIIRQLPSAQPEEDCDTCKHGYFGDDQCNNCRVRYPSHYERRTE